MEMMRSAIPLDLTMTTIMGGESLLHDEHICVGDPGEWTTWNAINTHLRCAIQMQMNHLGRAVICPVSPFQTNLEERSEHHEQRQLYP